MIKFDNPLDPSKDGINPFIDGIRYNIRNSEAIKEELIPHINYYVATANDEDSALDILDRMLYDMRINSEDLIISDEHELINRIEAQMSWIG